MVLRTVYNKPICFSAGVTPPLAPQPISQPHLHAVYSLATELFYCRLWAASRKPWGWRVECASPSVHIWEKFLSFANNKFCAFFEKACKIFICPLEHRIFKGQFFSCLLSQETWFRDSVKGEQILWLYSSIGRWEKRRTESSLFSVFLIFLIRGYIYQLSVL